MAYGNLHTGTGVQTTTTTTTTMPYPTLPASPTLTNPDMILPYDNSYDPPSPSGGGAWDDTRTTDMTFSIGPPAHMRGPLTPETPIIYGNGTMLSDIGEVTEVESTPRRLPAPAERRALKQMGGPMRATPSMGHSALLKRTKMGTHERKASVESTSTITSEGQAAEHLFADFDDGVSVDDSVFQGDDEESIADSSVADSYTEAIIASETQRLSRKESDISKEEEDKTSSAALSRRAEQILLNAKRRLNNMEGNLTRARTSLYITPSGSMSSIHSSSPLSRSTPSPPQNNNGLIPLKLGTTPLIHRGEYSSSSGGSPGHTRVYSENSIPSVQSQKEPFVLRSASAGGGFVSNNRVLRSSPHTSQENLSRHASLSRPVSSSPLTRTSPPSKASPPPIAVTLEPLSENDVSPSFGDRDGARTSIDDGYLSQNDNPRHLTRSASSMQMRDLRDQMSDLKGRLSSLRDRAREDNMRRRSMQSLRTPSPFTAAEQWYTQHKGYEEGGEPLSADKLVSQAPWKEELSEPKSPVKSENEMQPTEQNAEYADSDVTSIYEDVHENQHTAIDHHESRSIPEEEEEEEEEQANYEPEEYQQEQIPDGSESEYNEEFISREELDDYDSESDASVYHDTIMPISHEDREDAFDYEHFFLHSALGTISQQRNGRRGSTSSCSSDDSVATTRPIDTENSRPSIDDRTAMGHLRNGSTDSVSTLATFATAKSGQSFDEEDHDSYAVQQVIESNLLHTSTPLTAKRSTFGPPIESIPEDHAPSPEENKSRPGSVVYDGARQTSDTNPHRPSVSSFESFASTGTTRSFPLVNKPKSKPTTPDQSKAGSGVNGSDTVENGRTDPSPVNMLAKEDQILVERLVASLGKCVLGLQESGRGSYESRVWRRRLDAARRVLEGHEGAI